MDKAVGNIDNNITLTRKKSWGDLFNKYERKQSLDQIIRDFIPEKIDQPFRNIPGTIISLMHRIEIELNSKLFEYYIKHEEGKILEDDSQKNSSYNAMKMEIKRLENEEISAADCADYILYRLEVSDHTDLCNFIEEKFGSNLKTLLLKHLRKNKNRGLKTQIAAEWCRIKAQHIKSQYLIQYAKLILKNN